MKSLVYLAVFISIFSCKEKSSSNKATNSEGETSTIVESQDTPSEIVGDIKSVEDIKIEYTYITNKIENGGLDATSFEYNCHDEKKGKVSYFSEKGQLRMIRHTYNEYSHFSATDEYFVKYGALFFVFNYHLVWSFADHDQTKDDITEKRVYILDNKPVQCLQKTFTVLSNTKDAPKSPSVSNKEIDCPSLEPITEAFELFLKLRNQKEDLVCLEG